MLCLPLLRRFCVLALVTIKLFFKLVSVFEALTALPLATTADFSLSEEKSYRLVASSTSSVKVLLEISAALIAFTDFSVSSAFS